MLATISVVTTHRDAAIGATNSVATTVVVASVSVLPGPLEVAVPVRVAATTNSTVVIAGVMMTVAVATGGVMKQLERLMCARMKCHLYLLLC